MLVGCHICGKVSCSYVATGSLLVEDVHHIEGESGVLIERIVYAPKGLPAAFEVERIGLVDVLLALVAETEPEAP